MKPLLLAAVVTCTGLVLAGCQSTSVIKSRGSSFQVQIPKTGIGAGADEETIAKEIFVRDKHTENDVTKEGYYSVDGRVISEEVPSLSGPNELTFRKGWYRRTDQDLRDDLSNSYIEYKFATQCGETKNSYFCNAKTKGDAKLVVGHTRNDEVRSLSEGDVINALVRSYQFDYVTQTTLTPSAIAGKVSAHGRNAQVSEQKNTVYFHVSSEDGVAEVRLAIQEARPANRVEVRVGMRLSRSGAGDYDYTPLASKVEKFVQEVTGSI